MFLLISRMLLRTIISIGALAIAKSQPPAVSVIPQTGIYPVEGEMLTLACYRSPACRPFLQWSFGNTSTTNIIWSGTDMSDLGSSKGVMANSSDVNCNLTMTANRNMHDGVWFCICFASKANVNVDIRVLVSEVLPVSPENWEMQTNGDTNLTCKTSCAYPAPKITWTSSLTELQTNINHWEIPCTSQSGLVSSYSTYAVENVVNGDWFNCTAQNVPIRGVSGQFIVADAPSSLQSAPAVSSSYGVITIGIVVLVAVTCLVAGICIVKYKANKISDYPGIPAFASCGTIQANKGNTASAKTRAMIYETGIMSTERHI